MKYNKYFISLISCINIVYPLQLFIEILLEEKEFNKIYFSWFVIALIVLFGIILYFSKMNKNDNETNEVYKDRTSNVKLVVNIISYFPLLGLLVAGIILSATNDFSMIYLMEIILSALGILALSVYLFNDQKKAVPYLMVFATLNILYSFAEWYKSFNFDDYGVDGKSYYSDSNLLIWFITSIFLFAIIHMLVIKINKKLIK